MVVSQRIKVISEEVTKTQATVLVENRVYLKFARKKTGVECVDRWTDTRTPPVVPTADFLAARRAAIRAMNRTSR